MSQKYLILDFETRSEADLKKVGAYEYSRHPATEVLCVAWRCGTKEGLKVAPVETWSPFLDSPHPSQLLSSLANSSVIKVAHNSFFDHLISVYVLTRYFPELKLSFKPSRWMCTASMAAAVALPRKLEEACIALDLISKKDMVGHKLMLKYTKPRKETKNNKDRWHRNLSDLKRIIEYCCNDIKAQTELFLHLPPLTPKEREVWILDQKINFRGIKVDRPLIQKTLQLISEETDRLHAETVRITRGELTSTKKVAALRGFLWRKENIDLPNMQAKTISDFLLRKDISVRARRLLEIRQAVSRTSTAKYEAFERRSRYDGRIRDLLMYHGASTGRWSGMGVQVQNFPRGKIKNTWDAVEIIKQGDLDFIRALYGDPMELFSSCLRSVLIAEKGNTFFRGDFSSIEVRVLFWMADHTEGLAAYREKRDLYREMAQIIFRVKRLEDVTTEQREIGKRVILGCGYGMGHKKFKETCLTFGLQVSEALAKKAVEAYRETHPIPSVWSNLEQAAIRAIKTPGRVFRINRVAFHVNKNFLWCTLPSGRALAYYRPSVKYIETKWGSKKEAVHYWAVHSKTKKWVEEKSWGGIFCENADQAIARDLLVEAMLELEKRGYEIRMTVHDEDLSETSKGSIEEFSQIMTRVPDWAEGLPIALDSGSGPRYKKW